MSHAMRAVILIVAATTALAARQAADSIPALGGDITITPIAHATLHIKFGDHVLLVDPTVYGGWDGPHPGNVAPKINYAGLDAPTLILVTDVHGDHLDGDAIAALRKPSTTVVVPGTGGAGWQWIPGATQIANGQTRTISGISITAVPMYNLVRGPTPVTKFHDKGRGNGYVVTLGGKRIYISGDTECTAEMKALKSIDIAFIAMNLPFTATPEEAAECVAAFRPKIAYPYHYKGQDTKIFESRLAGSGVEVRLRDWYSPR
jgi:L-ascorbate metabolism protein UlaG (beta-lactamase superfamily)